MLELLTIFIRDSKIHQIDNRIDTNVRTKNINELNQQSSNDEIQEMRINQINSNYFQFKLSKSKKHLKNAFEIRKDQLANLIRFTILSLLITRCFANKMLPIFNKFELCSDGLRLSIVQIEKWNESSGLRITVKDLSDGRLYSVPISYFEHNLLPKFDNLPVATIHRLNGVDNQDTVHSIKQPATLYDYVSTNIQFKEHFFFFSTINGFNYLGGYSNELVGCPQLLCMNAYLDASFYHVGENVFYFFRGPYYYTINPRDDQFIIENRFNLIPTRFPFVPMNIDSATYIQTDLYPEKYVIIFSKEDQIYLYYGDKQAAVEVSQRKFLKNNSPAYIESIININNDKLLINFKKSFRIYHIDNSLNEENNEISFSEDSPAIITFSTNSTPFIDSADDSVTLFLKDEILFFYKFMVYTIKLGEFQKKLNHKLKKSESIIIEDYTMELFFDYFKCQADYATKINLDKDEFKEIYLKRLPNNHEPRFWHQLVSSVVAYDPTLTEVAIGMIFSFLIVGYMLLAIFLVFYYSSSLRIEQIQLTRESTIVDSIAMDRESRLDAKDTARSQKLPSTKMSKNSYDYSNANRFKTKQEFQVIRVDEQSTKNKFRDSYYTPKKPSPSGSEYMPAFSDYDPMSTTNEKPPTNKRK